MNTVPPHLNLNQPLAIRRDSSPELVTLLRDIRTVREALHERLKSTQPYADAVSRADMDVLEMQRKIETLESKIGLEEEELDVAKANKNPKDVSSHKEVIARMEKDIVELKKELKGAEKRLENLTLARDDRAKAFEPHRPEHEFLVARAAFLMRFHDIVYTYGSNEPSIISTASECLMKVKLYAEEEFGGSVNENAIRNADGLAMNLPRFWVESIPDLNAAKSNILEQQANDEAQKAAIKKKADADKAMKGLRSTYAPLF